MRVRILILAFVTILACAQVGVAEDRRADKNHLAIMTINAEWM